MQYSCALKVFIQEVENGGPNVAFFFNYSGVFNIEFLKLVFYVWHHLKEVHLLTYPQFRAI